MKAVNLGLAEFFIFCGDPRTRSRSWYHCRHVFNRASRYVSFCSFAIIAMQKRDAGRAKLIEKGYTLMLISFSINSNVDFVTLYGSPSSLNCSLHYLIRKHHQGSSIQFIRINDCLIDNCLYFWYK